MKRYILTGTPGAGKTTILRALQARGFDVVDEAATAVIAEQQASGVPEPSADPAFVDRVIAMQRRKQQERGSGRGKADVEVYDRSPVCTHALSVHLGYPISEALTAELDRIRRERIYERQVLFVRNIGFCEPTAARRITFEDSLTFERIHEKSYLEPGFELIDVPAADLGRRVDFVESTIRRLAEAEPERWT